MRKFKQVFLASVLASSMVVTPLFADDVSNLQNSKNAAQSEVNSLQSELQTLIEKMSKLEDDLVSTGQQITQAQDDLTVAEEKEHQQQHHPAVYRVFLRFVPDRQRAAVRREGKKIHRHAREILLHRHGASQRAAEFPAAGGNPRHGEHHLQRAEASGL